MVAAAENAKPILLISSSADLAGARISLSNQLRRRVAGLHIEVDTFLWEEETRGGLLLGQGTPVQQQIDMMLEGRLSMTLVMFGERIGEPLLGTPPEETASILAAWQRHGLVHPWPDDPAERWALLEAGHFPLTGTVYELLVGLKMERDDPSLAIRVAYVADREIGPATRVGDVRLNGEAHLHRSRKPAAGSSAYMEWERDHYLPQVQGIINLLRALRASDHGCYPLRFDSEEEMTTTLSGLAVELLAERAAEHISELVFKPDLSVYRIDDVLPLPDRRVLREELRTQLYAQGLAGRMLALRGPSGCGKSSLLQRGLLAELPKSLAGAIVLAVRPGDLGTRTEATPLLRLLGVLADKLDSHGLGGLGNLRRPQGATTNDRVAHAVQCLDAVLSASDKRLVLGLDQFEEVLDVASLDVGERRDRAGSWWQVLRFLGRAVRLDRVWLAATLEKQRVDRLEGMAVTDVTGLELETVNVDFQLGDIGAFVRHAATLKRLPLASKTVELIERMVEEFETQKLNGIVGRSTASFLPLLSVWMHRLFATFRDRMQSGEAGVAGEFERRTDEIAPRDVLDRGISFSLAPLVAEFVHDAWQEAGQLEAYEDGTLYDVADQAAFNQLVRQVSTWHGGMQLIAMCQQGGPRFDVQRFCEALTGAGLSELPGVGRRTRYSYRPSSISLENFLVGLIALDHDGNMRLTDAPGVSDVDSVSRLLASHLRRRLLEPVGSDRVRLIHQAVVDNWPPAREWYEAKVGSLARIRAMQQAARRHGLDADYAELAAGHPELIKEAAATLAMKRAIWSGLTQASLTDEEAYLRQFCLSLLAAAEDARLEFEVDGMAQAIAFEAARYDLAETLDRWLTADPTLVELRTQTGATLLDKASWAAASSVRVLLKHGMSVVEHDDSHWHPISHSIQVGRRDIIGLLLPYYDGAGSVIGPGQFTILHEAARARDPAVLQMIMTGEVDCDSRIETGATPLHLAASGGLVPQLRALMRKGDVRLRDSVGDTPLNEAARNNHADIVREILEHPDLTEADRDLLLCGRADETGWPTPIFQAAMSANPEALAALLAWCDPREERHRMNGMHILAHLVGYNGQQQVGAPLADRVTACVRVLLDDGRLTVEDALRAHGFGARLPDARRHIENWLARRGDLSDLPPEQLMVWLLGPSIRVALRVLRQRPDLLDHVDGDGISGAAKLLKSGQVAVLSAALRDNILPREQPELFALEAALRILAAAQRAEQSSDDRRPLNPFVGISRDLLHPVLQRIAADPEDSVSALLLSMGPSGGRTSLLHRLAARNQIEAFSEVLSGLSSPLPLEMYGRLPSAIAPPLRQGDFRELESQYVRKVAS